MVSQLYSNKKILREKRKRKWAFRLEIKTDKMEARSDHRARSVTAILCDGDRPGRECGCGSSGRECLWEGRWEASLSPLWSLKSETGLWIPKVGPSVHSYIVKVGSPGLRRKKGEELRMPQALWRGGRGILNRNKSGFIF